MRRQLCVVTSLVLQSCVILLIAGSRAQAQTTMAPPPAAALGPAPCSQPIQCPTPSATWNFVLINLKPDSSSVCRFEPRFIDDLDIVVGDTVTWSFCNACNVNMEVQLDTSSPGPFDRFRYFQPPPQADNLVTVQVPCYSTEEAYGFVATDNGDWKYWLRAKPQGAATFPDEIDPQLEIDDYNFGRWRERLLLVLLGLVGGALIVRRFLTQP